MGYTVSIDKVGRIVIPKPLRDALDLEPGESLDLENTGDAITLRPVRESIPIRKEDGVWVYRSGRMPKENSIRDLIAHDREERLRRVVR